MERAQHTVCDEGSSQAERPPGGATTRRGGSWYSPHTHCLNLQQKGAKTSSMEFMPSRPKALGRQIHSEIGAPD